jgi:deoxyribodipyrimidine photo-lyase
MTFRAFSFLMMQSAARNLTVLLESVDSNGLLPLRAASKTFSTAYSFRRFLQNELPRHLRQFPSPNPLARLSIPRLRSLPPEITSRWPPVTAQALEDPAAIAALPINHRIAPSPSTGGERAARTALRAFLSRRLQNYAELRNHPDEGATSGLSPWLHFGQISAHEIFHEITSIEDWTPEKLPPRATGSRTGWWRMSAPAEAFLDQLVTWREIGFSMSSRCVDYDRYESLPAWARRTLKKHARDKRAVTYSLDQFAAAETHDPLWNAAQRQLVSEGRLHNYLRMLWGKKILEWSPAPQDALDVMIELNNRYALDGRDPNSYSGILWCLGRYDRPWGPERPVFGTVRYMSSENTARKLSVKDYLARYS